MNSISTNQKSITTNCYLLFFVTACLLHFVTKFNAKRIFKFIRKTLKDTKVSDKVSTLHHVIVKSKIKSYDAKYLIGKTVVKIISIVPRWVGFPKW